MDHDEAGTNSVMACTVAGDCFFLGPGGFREFTPFSNDRRLMSMGNVAIRK